MARTFRRHRQSAPISELNLTNLIDLGFTLLIIFMIATPLINQEQTIPVQLPTESMSPQAQPDPDVVYETITVSADGAYVLGTQQVTLEQLAAELARFAALPNPPVFRLRIDAAATGQHFVAVLDELKKHALTKFTLDTQIPR